MMPSSWVWKINVIKSLAKQLFLFKRKSALQISGHNFNLKDVYQIMLSLFKKLQKAVQCFNVVLAIKLRCNISNTRDSVWPHFQAPRSSSKILRYALYFQLSSYQILVRDKENVYMSVRTLSCWLVLLRNWISSACFFSSTALLSASRFSMASHLALSSLTCRSRSRLSPSSSWIYR